MTPACMRLSPGVSATLALVAPSALPGLPATRTSPLSKPGALAISAT
jgi:hypothetical protein